VRPKATSLTSKKNFSSSKLATDIGGKNQGDPLYCVFNFYDQVVTYLRFFGFNYLSFICSGQSVLSIFLLGKNLINFLSFFLPKLTQDKNADFYKYILATFFHNKILP